jgi:hypothetical protein
MNRNRVAAIACCALAIACARIAIGIVGRMPGLDDPSGEGVSEAIGTFLPTLLLLILGAWLWQKGGSK